tara:strand:- start:933 stop:2087 length:1155 start_codon:yes stop_codon:yes gene_type:complete
VALNINLKMINNQKGNALFLACGIVSAIIIIFWLMPQFAYNTIYLYFRGIQSISQMGTIEPQSNLIEDQKRSLKLDPKITFLPSWEIKDTDLNQECEKSRKSRQALNLMFNNYDSKHKDRPMIWISESDQLLHHDHLVHLTGLDFYCHNKVERNLASESKLLLEMSSKMSLIRRQVDFNHLHVDRKSFLINPARTLLYALESIQDFDSIKGGNGVIQLEGWKHWLDMEKRILKQFFDRFGSKWIPGNLQRLLNTRNRSSLGLWKEIRLKELVQGLHFRRNLYKNLLGYTSKIVENNNFNPNKIKLIETSTLEKLNQKFKHSLNNGRYERFLDFLIAPRGFERRVKHSCYKDLSSDLQNGIFEGIRWQLRLIARIEFAIERIKEI